MSNKQQNRSREQEKQAAGSNAAAGKQPENAGFDKKLDGPNRPSV